MPNTYSGYAGTSKLSGGTEIMATVVYPGVGISAQSCTVMRPPRALVPRVAVREDGGDHTRIGDRREHAKLHTCVWRITTSSKE